MAESIRICDTSNSHRYKDDNGYLIIRDNPIAKAGVFEYLLSELDLQNSTDDKIVKVCRTLENLANNKDRFANMPLKLGHSWVGDSIGDDKQVDGVIASNVRVSEPYLVADLIIYNPEVIGKIESGEIVELSPGYEAKFIKQSGTYNGEAYDFIQELDNVNHLAVVKEGRSGSDLRILDTKKEINLMKFKDKLMSAFKRVLDENIDSEEASEVEFKDDIRELALKLIDLANASDIDNEAKVNNIIEVLKGFKTEKEPEVEVDSVSDDEMQIEAKKDDEVQDEVIEAGEVEKELTAQDVIEIIEKVTDSKIEKMKSILKQDSKAVYDAYDNVKSVLGCEFSYQDKSVDEIYKFGYEALSKTKLQDKMDALTAFKIEASKIHSSDKVKTSDSVANDIYAELSKSIKL